jgi:hypothetical protein
VLSDSRVYRGFLSALTKMNTRIKILVLFSLIALTSNGQDYKSEIENARAKYLNSFNRNDFLDLLNYVPEEYFVIYSREQVLFALETSVREPETELEINEQKIIEIGDVELIQGRYYCLLTYSKRIKFRYNKNTRKETEEEYKSRMHATSCCSKQNMEGRI